VVVSWFRLFLAVISWLRLFVIIGLLFLHLARMFSRMVGFESN